MAYTLKTNLANKSNYGRKRQCSSIKFIVIHYTANDGDTDENNGKYFHNNIVNASAHYFVDSDSITQSVPDDCIAYSVGGKKYNNGGGEYYNKCVNNNSLSIELCDDVKNKVIYPTQATIDNAIEFTKTKMIQYGINKTHVIRHYQVNGKPCPVYWVDNSKWKTEFHNKLQGWTRYNDKWYWLDSNGNVVKNSWIQDKNKWYHLSSTGVMDTNNWIKNSSNTWSYVNNKGEAVVGWHNLSWNNTKSWYYFDEKGIMVSSKWIKDKGKDYYLTSSGAMATNSYIKSTSSSAYYWVGVDGAWQPEWNTNTPDLKKYKVVK